MTAQTRSRFRVTVLGPFEVCRDDASLDAGSWQRSVQTLLKLLVTSPERRRLRDEVVDVLWPDATPEAGASNLRYVLSLLRRHLRGGDPSPILADRSWISLNPGYTWAIDLARFEDLTAQGASNRETMDELAALYQGEPLVEDRYEDWAAPLRAHIQRLWQETCRRFAHTLHQREQLEPALLWAERALAADPVDEESFQQVLKLLILLGRRTEAMKRFRQFEQQLRSELDLEPSPETAALVSRAREPEEVAIRPRVEQEESPPRTSRVEVPQQALPAGAYLGALPSTPLVARREELSRALVAVDTAAQGSGRLVLLAGEPGVGKTRLAQEVTAALHERGFLIAAGRCYQPEQVVPYYPFLDVLGELYRLLPPQVREEVVRRWPYLARLLPELQGAGRKAAAPIGEIDGQDEPLLIRSVAGFLETVAADRGLAVLLDDLHWSDSASVKLLLHLARHTRASPVFLLGTYRDLEVTYDHPLHGALVDLGREALLEKIALERLDAEATGALIAGALGDAAIPPGLVEIVHGPTGGNPFFIQEVLRSMVEGGDLMRTDGRWERRQRSEIRVPEGVRGVIGQRLSRLREETRGVLFAGSVLGQTFRFEEVEQVSGRAEEQVESALEEASRAGLVRETHPDVYAFSHALAQQAVYGEMTGRKQRRLHLLAAETLEGQQDRERRAAEIASHFLRAGEKGRSIPYSMLAGDAARDVFAHTEAEAHYRSALEAAEEIGSAGQEAEALEKLAATLVTRGGYQEAEECAQRSLSVFRSIDDTDGEMRAATQLSRASIAQGRAREAVAVCRRLLESLDKPPTSASLAMLYLQLGESQHYLGDYEQALHSSEEATKTAQILDDQRLLVQAELLRILEMYQLGRQWKLHLALEAPLRRAEEKNDLFLQANLLLMLGLETAYQGELGAAREYRERQVDVARRIGSPAHLAGALTALGSSLFLLGDWQQARASMEEALQIGRSIDKMGVLVVPLLDLGHLTVCEGDWEAGEALLREAVELAEQGGDLGFLRFANLFLANLDLLRAKPQAVIERLTPLIDRSGNEEPGATPLLPPLAQAYLDLGEVDRAERVAEDACRRTAESGNRIDLLPALLGRAGVLAKQERWDEARASIEEAVDLGRQMTFPAGEALALHRWGTLESLAGNLERAHSYLLQARAIYHRLGAREDVERIDETLEQLRPAG